MKILLPFLQRNWYEGGDFFDNTVVGGLEKFARLVYNHYEDIELLQVEDYYLIDSRKDKIKKREQIQKQIIDKSKEINADIIISNQFDSSFAGKHMLQSNIPILYITHGNENMLSRLSVFERIKKNNHSLYLVSQYQKNYYDAMLKRVGGDGNLNFDGYIEPAFVYGVKPKVIDNPEFDCVTIGRTSPLKNPFLLKQLTKGISLKTLVMTNKIPKVDIYCYPYYCKHKNWDDVLWDLEHDDVLKNLSRGKTFFSTCPEETFGITALEALSCGLPVILSSKKNCHASEIIPTDKTHYKKVEHKDKDALISAINSFRDIDRQEIQDMTWDKYTEKRWKSILDNAIDKTIENFKSNRGVLPI
jgi:hypothetical protein